MALSPLRLPLIFATMPLRDTLIRHIAIAIDAAAISMRARCHARAILRCCAATLLCCRWLLMMPRRHAFDAIRAAVAAAAIATRRFEHAAFADAAEMLMPPLLRQIERVSLIAALFAMRYAAATLIRRRRYCYDSHDDCHHTPIHGFISI